MSSDLPKLQGQMPQHLEYSPNAPVYMEKTTGRNNQVEKEAENETHLNSLESSPHMDLS